MAIKYHKDLIQRSPEWYEARCGLLTASNMKRIIAPAKLQYADNATCREHMADLCAQRITKHVDSTFQSFDMLRGHDDEADAKYYYRENYGEIDDCGFITNNSWGFTLGFSPDGLIGDDGIVEAKGKLQKLQMEIIHARSMPDEFRIQVQTGLMVSGRKWCDFISYSNGFNMLVIRVEADLDVQHAIFVAALEFHNRLGAMMEKYEEIIADKTVRLIPVDRRPVEGEIQSS